MRRILLLNTDLEIGGTPTVVRELAVRLKQCTGTEVEVACLARSGPMADRIRQAGIQVHPLDAAGIWDLAVLRRLTDLIRDRGYDTVLSFLVHANAAAAWSSRSHPNVRYLQAIQTTQRWPRWHWWVQGLAQRAAEWIVVPSQSVAQAAAEWAGIPNHRIVVIPNAVDLADYEATSHDHDSQSPFPIGFLGRLDRVKRVRDLIEAVGRLNGRVQLHVFGDGDQRAAIESTIAQLQIAKHVTMHGRIDCPQDALARIGMLVLASEAEGFPMVLIEAMAAGVPIVATDAPGIRDVVSDGQTGVLTPVGDVGRLAEAIERVAGDRHLRQRLAERARIEVRERFSWRNVIGAYRALLDIGG